MLSLEVLREAVPGEIVSRCQRNEEGKRQRINLHQSPVAGQPLTSLDRYQHPL